MNKTVLIIEDEELDCALLQRAIRSTEISCRCIEARDGAEACQVILEEGRSIDLVLLDLHLPKMSGFDVLKHVRSHAPTRDVPVVVLSTSDEFADMQRAYALGANSYVQKCFDMEAHCSKVKILLCYWFAVNSRVPQGVGFLPSAFVTL